MSEHERRPRFELWGKSIREIGVLLLVFVPLDVLVEPMHDSQKRSGKHWFEMVVFALFGLGTDRTRCGNGKKVAYVDSPHGSFPCGLRDDGVPGFSGQKAVLRCSS